MTLVCAKEIDPVYPYQMMKPKKIQENLPSTQGNHGKPQQSIIIMAGHNGWSRSNLR